MRLAVLGSAPVRVERADAARNRQRILDAARGLLRDRPIREIAMDDVAAAAGVGKGTLYRRFADRASLCRALLDEPARHLQNAALAGFGLPFDPPWLRHAIALWDALFDFSVEHAALLEEAMSYSRAADRYRHPAHLWQHEALGRFLERAAEAGEISAADPSLAADMALALLAPELLAHRLPMASAEVLKEGLRGCWVRALG